MTETNQLVDISTTANTEAVGNNVIDCWSRPNPWIHITAEDNAEPNTTLMVDDTKPAWGNKNQANANYPVTQYEWRITGDVLPEAVAYHAATRQEYSVDNVKTIVEKGGSLIAASGSSNVALFHFQELEFRK